MTFGETIKKARLKKGISLLGMELITGIKNPNIAAYEQGRKTPRSHVILVKLANALDLDDILLEGMSCLDRGVLPEFLRMNKSCMTYLQDMVEKECTHG